MSIDDRITAARKTLTKELRAAEKIYVNNTRAQRITYNLKVDFAKTKQFNNIDKIQAAYFKLERAVDKKIDAEVKNAIPVLEHYFIGKDVDVQIDLRLVKMRNAYRQKIHTLHLEFSQTATKAFNVFVFATKSDGEVLAEQRKKANSKYAKKTKEINQDKNIIIKGVKYKQVT